MLQVRQQLHRLCNVRVEAEPLHRSRKNKKVKMYEYIFCETKNTRKE